MGVTHCKTTAVVEQRTMRWRWWRKMRGGEEGAACGVPHHSGRVVEKYFL